MNFQTFFPFEENVTTFLPHGLLEYVGIDLIIHQKDIVQSLQSEMKFDMQFDNILELKRINKHFHGNKCD